MLWPEIALKYSLEDLHFVAARTTTWIDISIARQNNAQHGEIILISYI